MRSARSWGPRGGAASRRERDRESVLRHAVAGQECVRVEAGDGEALPEGLQRVRAHRLGTAPRDPPGGEIELLEICGLESPETEIVGKARREADTAAVA